MADASTTPDSDPSTSQDSLSESMGNLQIADAESSSVLENEEATRDNRTIANTTMAQVANQCNGQCGGNPIYHNDEHITRRHDGNQLILGNDQQFCAAFYHVNEWGDPPRKLSCLDKEEHCIVFDRLNTNSKRVQPQKVVAVVKFVNGGERVYEARYTNCVSPKKHAEDFFHDDVRNGVLATKIKANHGGTITMYLTFQPCNWSTTIKRDGTPGTRQYHSCCETLRDVFTDELQPHGIQLCIKPTHLCRLEVRPEDANDNENQRTHDNVLRIHDDVQQMNNIVNEHLRKNAVRGIRMLMRIGVDVTEMTPGDWPYLSGMAQLDADVRQRINNEGVNRPRKQLDAHIRNILNQIRAQVRPPQA